LFRQRGRNDCGLAALATIAEHHGKSVNYDEFAGEVALQGDGTDLLTLSKLAQRLGFRTLGIQSSYEALAACDLPAIAHVRHDDGAGHFIVLLEWTPNFVTVADPGRGLRTISRKRFSRRRTGYLLLIQPPAT
jgi:ATP-binding cassette subfamily B protein